MEAPLSCKTYRSEEGGERVLGKSFLLATALLMAAAFMGGCGEEGQQATPTPTALARSLSSPTPLATPTPTGIPSPTPTQPIAPPTPTAPAACTAPDAPPASGVLKGQGCVILNVPAGKTEWVEVQRLAGTNIACAGALSTHGWKVWLPPDASVTLYGVHQGIRMGEWSGNSGTASGYCGAIAVENPNNFQVTVHLSWKMWCRGPC